MSRKLSRGLGRRLSKRSGINNDGGEDRFAFGRRDWPFDSGLVRWLRLCRWSRQSRCWRSRQNAASNNWRCTCIWSSNRRFSGFRRFLHWFIFNLGQRKELLCNFHFAEYAPYDFVSCSIQGQTIQVEALLNIHQPQNPSKDHWERNGMGIRNLGESSLLQVFSPVTQNQ